MRLIPTLGQSIGYKSPQRQEGELRTAQMLATERAELFKKQMEAQAKRLREMQESSERTQWMTPPAAQAIGATAQTEDERKRKMGGNRGSLLAGNTGGYNPATGGGRLGGMMRSLLG